MSTSLSVIIRRFAMIFAAAGVAFGVILLFTFDVIKIDWPSFMEIQPSYRPMENPLPPPERSIPIEGPIVIPGMGAPENPVKADDASIARGSGTLFHQLQNVSWTDRGRKWPDRSFSGKQTRKSNLSRCPIQKRRLDIPDDYEWRCRKDASPQ